MPCALIALHVMTSLSAANEGEDPRGLAVDNADYATLAVSRLQCSIGNNKTVGDHRPGYNGIFAMTSPDQETSPYVPFYAGLNLEHYFDLGPRRADGEVLFEPRFAPMTFTRVNETTVDLHQPPTPVYGVESWTRFEVREPYYVDMTFRCIPRKPAFKGDTLGVFWASYMNGPDNKSVYFLGPGAALDKPKWLQFCTQHHDHFSTVLHEAAEGPVDFEDGPPVLYNQISPLRYSQPFYYGRIRNMALIYVFKPTPYLRFAHSPSGGGRTPDETDTCPAWDFQLVVPDCEVGREYELEMRAVYKPWVDRADVLNEVRGALDALAVE